MGRSRAGAGREQSKSGAGLWQGWGRSRSWGEAEREGETMTTTTKSMMKTITKREIKRHNAAGGLAKIKGSAFGQHKAVLLSTLKNS